jgi:hypothetical protein
MNPFKDRDDAFQIQSIKSANLREDLGGAKAADSTLFLNAVDVLMSRGWTPVQIIERLSSKTDASGAA